MNTTKYLKLSPNNIRFFINQNMETREGGRSTCKQMIATNKMSAVLFLHRNSGSGVSQEFDFKNTTHLCSIWFACSYVFIRKFIYFKIKWISCLLHSYLKNTSDASDTKSNNNFSNYVVKFFQYSWVRSLSLVSMMRNMKNLLEQHENLLISTFYFILNGLHLNL